MNSSQPILLKEAFLQAKRESQMQSEKIPDFTNETLLKEHINLFCTIANSIVLQRQNRKFIIDDSNRKVIQFLLYYFNGSPLAEKIYPDRGYKLHKNILLMGPVGSGKTLLMEIFSEYLRITENPRAFHNLSVTQMVNYYTLHNNLDRYTFNEESGRGFCVNPVNVCLNDIGVQTTTFFGMDTRRLVDEFLLARNDIWMQNHKFAHLTTNLNIEQLKETFHDNFDRLIDRFKTYNVITLEGDSRR